jgi:hypothetical protein
MTISAHPARAISASQYSRHAQGGVSPNAIELHPVNPGR